MRLCCAAVLCFGLVQPQSRASAATYHLTQLISSLSLTCAPHLATLSLRLLPPSPPSSLSSLRLSPRVVVECALGRSVQ